jgi:FkbM family methyltransferase
MTPRSPVLSETIGRIWDQVITNTGQIGDLFERIGQTFYTKLVRPGDIVVDGGAHAGRHAIPLARLVAPTGTVVAFEPLSSAADRLRTLLSTTGLDRHVRLNPQALAREAGRRTFYVVHNMPEYSGLVNRAYADFVPDQTETTVDVVTLDAALEAAPQGPLSVIKLDLEGGEFRALQGAERTLRTRQPTCIFENGLESTATAAGYDASEFFSYFASIDYELFDILGCPVDETLWRRAGPWYFVAIPRARATHLLPLLWTSALEELLSAPWMPNQSVGPAPPLARFQSGLLTVPNTSVMGHVDRFERCLLVHGWAGEPGLRRPTGSLVLTVDGVPVATLATGKPRFDVVAATGVAELERAGFEVVVRTAGQNIGVYAEAADGSYVELQGTKDD